MNRQTLHHDISEVIIRAQLPPDEVLIVLAHILVYIVSVQDRTRYSPEAVMLMVSENFSAGGAVIGERPTGMVN